MGGAARRHVAGGSSQGILQVRSIVSPPYYFSLLVYDSMRRMRRPSSAGQHCRSIALGKGLAALCHLGLLLTRSVCDCNWVSCGQVPDAHEVFD
jgi:hypothetical protein